MHKPCVGSQEELRDAGGWLARSRWYRASGGLLSVEAGRGGASSYNKEIPEGVSPQVF